MCLKNSAYDHLTFNYITVLKASLRLKISEGNTISTWVSKLYNTLYIGYFLCNRTNDNKEICTGRNSRHNEGIVDWYPAYPGLETVPKVIDVIRIQGAKNDQTSSSPY